MSDTTIDCTVLLFAELAERAGARSITLRLEPNETVDDVLTTIATEYPGVAPLLDTVAVALDEQYVQRDAAVTPGATIALIPPVSGG